MYMPPPLETPLHLPSHPTSHRALLDLPALYSNFPLAVYFIHGNVYVSTLLSQFVSPSSSLIVPSHLFSTSASLFLPCKQVHQHHFSRFHIYALIRNIWDKMYLIKIFN